MAYGYNFADFLSEALGTTGQHLMTQGDKKRKAQQQAIQDELEWWYKNKQVEQDQSRIDIARSQEARLAGDKDTTIKPMSPADLLSIGYQTNDVTKFTQAAGLQKSIDLIDPPKPKEATPPQEGSMGWYIGLEQNKGRPILDVIAEYTGAKREPDKPPTASQAQVLTLSKFFKSNAEMQALNEASSLAGMPIKSGSEIGAYSVPQKSYAWQANNPASRFFADMFSADDPAVEGMQGMSQKWNEIQQANWQDSARAILSPAQQATGMQENQPQAIPIGTPTQATGGKIFKNAKTGESMTVDDWDQYGPEDQKRALEILRKQGFSE